MIPLCLIFDANPTGPVLYKVLLHLKKCMSSNIYGKKKVLSSPRDKDIKKWSSDVRTGSKITVDCILKGIRIVL